jgi:CTP:molybdopterin cytidylyltransferase MocA
MGGAKALLLIEGLPLVQLHLQRLHEAGCRSIAVVVRPEVALVVEELLAALPYAACVRVVMALTDSQAGSLAVGFRALSAGAPAGVDPRDVKLLVTPVDMLPPKGETLEALLAALEGDVLAATPLRRGRGGHPVAVRAALLAPYLAGVGEGLPSLRELLTGAAHRRVRVEVEDDAIHGDLDTPSDVRAVPRFLAARASH